MWLFYCSYIFYHHNKLPETQLQRKKVPIWQVDTEVRAWLYCFEATHPRRVSSGGLLPHVSWGEKRHSELGSTMPPQMSHLSGITFFFGSHQLPLPSSSAKALYQMSFISTHNFFLSLISREIANRSKNCFKNLFVNLLLVKYFTYY